MNLARFVDAQADPGVGFDAAVRELEAGQKRSHWIWYIFPQFRGLGSSAMADHYGVADMAEAQAYLRDPLLRGRLLRVMAIVANHLCREAPVALEHLMGARIDAQKVVSSATLFREVARRLNATEPAADYQTLAKDTDGILKIAATQGLPECQATLRQLLASPI